MSFRFSFCSLVLLFSFLVVCTACHQAADGPEEASTRLTSAPEWTLSEIYVNDALTFKDGKKMESFGTITFDRYMEKVQFRGDGTFVGHFKGETQPMTLRWKVDSTRKTIQVGAADTTTAGGTWTIAPVNVFEDAFEMKTESRAYDYPQVTRIALKFKSEK